MDRKIIFEKSDNITRIILNNPDNRNGIDLEFCLEFADLMAKVAVDTSLSAIIIEAKGPYFSVGGDLRGFIENEKGLQTYILRCVTQFHAAIQHLYQSSAPVVVGLEGMAAGAGFSLVCGADIVMAKRSAKLVSSYTKSNLTPDGGATFFLPRLVGWQKAFEIFAFNEPMSADYARELGIVTQVIDDESFRKDFEVFVEKLKAMPFGVLSELKRLMRASQANSLPEQLAMEGKHIAQRGGLPETLEILKKFLNR